MKPKIITQPHMLGKVFRLLGLSYCLMMTSVASADTL
jgi:hypothetical protein